MDLMAIATNLAARYVDVVATNGSETETATATAELPDSVASLALLVYPPEAADLSLLPGPSLDDHYLFAIRLLRDPLSTPTRTRWLYAWGTAMRTRVQQKVQLDLPGVVAMASAVSMRIEIDGERYSSVDGTYAPFDVVEVGVDVHVREPTTAAA
jgi:hypothetical protein